MAHFIGLQFSNKVLILGCTGSGKSTFSNQLSKAQKLPVIHLDSLYWKSGWIRILFSFLIFHGIYAFIERLKEE